MAARKFLVPVDFTKNEIQNAVVQLLGAAPGSPVEGQLYHNSTSHLLMYHNGTTFVSDTDRSRHTGTQLAATISDFSTAADARITAAIGTSVQGLDADLTALAALSATAGMLSRTGAGAFAVRTISSATTALTWADPTGAAGNPTATIADAIAGGASGLMSGASLTKLNGIASGATANSSDATLLARANHTGTQLAATISDFDTQVRTSRLDQMAAPTASVSLNSQKITNLLDGSGAQDAATYGQLTAAIAAANNVSVIKGAVKAASGTNVNISSPGANIDGIAGVNGDIFLLYGQTTGNENGPYTYNGSGSAMTRAANWDTNGEASLGSYWIVEQGTKADTFAILSNDTAITLGSTTATFVFTGAGTSYTGSAGVSLVGSDFRLDTAHARNVDHTGVTLTAGAGLTGGGDISANRSFAVGAGTGITVNADDVAVDTTVVARKYTTLNASGGTSWTVNHALGNQWVHVQIIEVATLKQVEADITLTDANNVTVLFAASQSANAFRAIVIG